LRCAPFASRGVQALKGVLVRAKSLEESNLPLLLRVRVLRVTRVARIAVIARIIIATYKLLACVNKVEQEIYYLASNIPSKGASIRF
jgi:hypothetical protein